MTGKEILNAKLIQDLKDNKRAFGLMSEEMQAKAYEVKKNNGFFEFWHRDQWSCAMDPSWNGEVTYRLRRDYEPKPEIVECKVEPDCNGNLAFTLGDNERLLSSACFLPDFIGFKYEGGFFTTEPRKYIVNGTTFRDIGCNVDNYEVLTPIAVLFRSKK